jgi:hypothetical protein
MLHRQAVTALAMSAEDIGKRGTGDAILRLMTDATINWATCPSSKLNELTALLQQLSL